jgi:TolB-like protein/AraC-like DNA-binding protein
VLSEKSIAVLPFVNMSSDPDNEYFSDGVTEEIINALTSINGLMVIARTSSFAFKNKNLDVRSIAKQLGVKTILEGSVRKASNRLRISAQLIEAESGIHLWSKSYDRDLEDIFEVQDEISLLIADKIRENFGHIEIDDHLIEDPEIGIEDYQLFLKARHYLQKFNTGDIKSGIALLEDIVNRHPSFALAHVSIHYGYNMMAAGGLMPVEEALGIGKRHLDTALKLDSKLPECYHSLGWHSLNQDWDFTQATKHLMKAIELRPGYADAHQKLFINLALEGNLDLAHQHIKTALKLDPLAVLNNYFTGYYHYLKEDFIQSNQFLEKAFEIEPAFIVGYSIYSLSLSLQKRPDYIIEKSEAIPEMDGAKTEKLIMQTMAYAQMNEGDKLEHGLNLLHQELDGERSERVRFFMVYIYTILQKFEEALSLIEDGVKNREPLMTLVKVDPLLRPLHGFKRFQNALTSIYALSEMAVPEPVQAKTSQVDITEGKRILNRLNELMENEKPFLNPSFSLQSLAQATGNHANKISWVINEVAERNFNDYVNAYRLKEFKQMATDSANSHLSLLGIALESGFNSKSTFNAYFKKVEGTTPKAWLRLNQSL